jgi:hypothetical protein
MRYKEQMSKLRNGPGKVVSPPRFVFLFLSKADRNNVGFCMDGLNTTDGQDAIQQRALRTLKQKRMYEAQLAQLAQQTFNIESTALATENLRNTMVTLDAMAQANKDLRKQYGKIDIGKIEVRTMPVIENSPGWFLIDPTSPLTGPVECAV